MVAIPDRINIDSDDREIYKRIFSELDIFKEKRTAKEQFLFTMALGFEGTTPISLKKKDGFFLFKRDLNKEDEALIESVGVHKVGSVDVLSNKSELYKIAEEYAHAGLKLLNDIVGSSQFGSFWKHFEKKLIDNYGL